MLTVINGEKTSQFPIELFGRFIKDTLKTAKIHISTSLACTTFQEGLNCDPNMRVQTNHLNLFSDVEKLKQEAVQRFNSFVKQKSFATTLDSSLTRN
jgi:hypothetical protein